MVQRKQDLDQAMDAKMKAEMRSMKAR